jgi:hypothetical protein
LVWEANLSSIHTKLECLFIVEINSNSDNFNVFHDIFAL